MNKELLRQLVRAFFWDQHIKMVFPYAPDAMTVSQLRQRIYDDIFIIRGLRNRIAHHEPIFSRNNQDDYNQIYELISWRDKTTADWMDSIAVTELITKQPTA